jgi:TATA-binding protein-associated factor
LLIYHHRLLEKGSTPLIRNTAAQQLADIQKQHPDELFNLLGRVLPYLKAHAWDTRTAAAKAIGGIVSHVEKFNPNADEADVKPEGNGCDDKTESKAEPATPDCDELLQLDNLDINSILQYGKKLLGSAGKEYEYSLAGLDAAQRLAFQKQTLTSRLGLGGEYIEDDLVNSTDFTATAHHKFPSTSGLPRVDTSFKSRQTSIPSAYVAMSPMEPTTPGATCDESGLSKRQINQLKRKNKSMAKAGGNKMRVVDLSVRRSSEIGHTPTSATPYPVKLGSEDETNGDQNPDYFSIKRENDDDDSKVVSEFKGEVAPEKPMIQTDAEEQGLEWPFERMCEFMTVDLFDPYWELRHGAAMGLREVIRVHGAGAGRRFGKSKADNDVLNRKWLDDLACRLLCVLMLDRFGDYVSDTVVAPIRETVGQTLGALLSQLPGITAMSVYTFLNRMIIQKDLGIKHPVWEVCHGGMIGLKYFVAVRRDLLLHHSNLIDGVVDSVMRGLAHHDDDVRSVSAATLIPIAEELIQLKSDSLSNLINVVWDCLSDLQDDLSASTGAVMDLLAKLCTFPEVLQAMKSNALVDPESSFAMLVPRLYPFFRHTITTVRSAVLRAILTFLALEGEGVTSWVGGKVARLIFQNILVERDEGVLCLSLQVWTELLRQMDSSGLVHFREDLESHLPPIISITMHPIGLARSPIPMDLSLFIKPSGVPFASHTLPPARHSSNNHSSIVGKRKSEKKEETTVSTHNVDGQMLHGEVELVGQDTLVRSRIYAARALGLFISYWDQNQFPEQWTEISSHLTSQYSSTQLVATMVIEEYASHSASKAPSPSILSSKLLAVLESDRPLWYTDIASILQAARGQCHAMLDAFKSHAHVASMKFPNIPPICQGDVDAGPNAFSLSDAERIVNDDFNRLMKLLTPAQRVTGVQYLTDARENARIAVNEAKRIKELREMRIRAAAASALVALKDIPKKPSLVIKNIMDSVKLEENSEIQQRSSAAIASLIDFYNAAGKRGPIEKILGNLVKFCCVDTSETPEFHPNAQLENAILSLRKEEDRKDHPDAAKFEREAKEARIMRRGSKRALENLANMYGASLFDKLPSLRSLIETPARNGLVGDLPADVMESESQTGQDIIDGLSTLRALAPTLDRGLHAWMVDLLPVVANALRNKLSVIRYSAAKCFATLCSVITVEGMTMLVENVLPGISNAIDVHHRQGAVECIYHLMHVMEEGILPYVIFLIVPVLGRMSDSSDDVRLLATTSFATLVKLVPLEVHGSNA